MTNPYHDDHESMATMDILGRLCRRLPTACHACCLLAPRKHTGWILGAPQRSGFVVSGDRSDIAARHSMLLFWRGLEEMGGYGLRCRVIRINLHVCDGPLKVDVLRERHGKAT
jgi:hypothetical protein